jgi:flagellar protein FliO/FliZ
MFSFLTALVLHLNPSAPEVGSAAIVPPPAPASVADSVVAAAFTPGIDTPDAELKTSQGGFVSVLGPASVLIALGALAFVLSRRRSSGGRNITLIESASLGPKRSVVVADILGERMVLGVSEAGIAVLSTRPAPLVAPVTPSVPAQTAPPMTFFDRLRGRVPTPPSSFEDTLREIEEGELRAKLALGQRGVVR